ncbi:MAG: hypothetical protein A2620_04095 [Acidobacteria bacterium RIFCSPHIGHO2_01_FULL_67_28]|nr:MAG: hypothetical protein A2620_04095 [Acidobacteria bacterium RIFCSPHIGHO2_01_FULL_67_28]
MIAAIVNPRAADRRAERRWPELRPQMEAVLGALEVYQTTAPGHAIELTRKALGQGARTVIAVGGDGTVSEVVNGFFDGTQPVAAGVVLGIIPLGTGSDLCRTLGLPLEERAALEVIRRGATRRIDLESARFETLEGRPGQRLGVNITSFGMGGLVAARANRASKWLGGKALFQWTTLRTALTFRGNTVRLRLDGRELPPVKITNVAVGNAQFHGAGMWACPRAVVDDGLLDVTVFRYLSLLEIVGAFPRLYNGKIYEHPKVEFHRARRVEATAEEPAYLEVDGEPVGRLPLEITVLPQALTVCVPA